MRQVREEATESIELPAGSWGSGKDWRVWEGEQVQDIVALHEALQQEFLTHLDACAPLVARMPYLDDALQQLFLALASDWAFMVTKDSAADYARARAYEHGERMRSILRSRIPDSDHADRVFGHLDARCLTPARP